MPNNIIQYLKLRPVISLTTFNLVLSLWIALVLNTSFLKKIDILTPYQGIKSYAFFVATILILIGLYNLIFQIIHWKYSTKFFACLFIFVGGFSTYFVNSFGVIVNADQIQNIMQTDPNEALDLITFNLLLWFIFLILIPIILILIIQLKPEKFKVTLLKKSGMSIASLTIIFALLFIYYVDFASIFRGNRELKGMISPQNVFAASHSYYRKKVPKKNLPHIIYGEDAKIVHEVSALKKPKLLVLVIGETARAESFELNGYAKKTNPKLSQQNIINFSQVSSCGTSTAVSLPCMFSGMPRKDYDEHLARHRDGLLDIAQRAGYKVTWIENNSGCKGICDRVNQYVIPQAIHDKWCKSDGCDDSLLIDSVKDYLTKIDIRTQQPELLVLHQMGSHGPAYYKRSTAEFQTFKPTCDTNSIQGCDRKALINTYDNSIVYTDHILSSIIDILKDQTSHQTSFLYVSDHGESTGEHGMYLHGAPYTIAPKQQTHIPMLMWFSNEWKKVNPKQIECLNHQRHQPLSHDHLFPTVLKLLDIKTQVSDSKLDILNLCKTPI